MFCRPLAIEHASKKDKIPAGHSYVDISDELSRLHDSRSGKSNLCVPLKATYYLIFLQKEKLVMLTSALTRCL